MYVQLYIFHKYDCIDYPHITNATKNDVLYRPRFLVKKKGSDSTFLPIQYLTIGRNSI